MTKDVNDNSQNREEENNQNRKNDDSEELIYEDDQVENNLSSIEEKVEKLKKRLKQCQAEKEEHLTNWQKSQADLANYRKRQEERIKEIYQAANVKLINDLLPVLDALEKAIECQDSNQKTKQGLDFLYNQFKSVLSNYGLEIINPVGENFNPDFCEAVDIIPCSKEDEGKVMEVIQKGYVLDHRLLRPAKVRVGKATNS